LYFQNRQPPPPHTPGSRFSTVPATRFGGDAYQCDDAIFQILLFGGAFQAGGVPVLVS